MSDLLSQAEIDALLNGFGGEGGEASAPAESSAQAEVQETAPTSMSSNSASGSVSSGDIELTDEEKDVLGEVGNISMGASATTLSTLINQEVNITTPRVEVMSWDELVDKYPKPYIVAKVEYTEGLIGSNLLIMKVEDIQILTNLMMGEEVKMEAEQLNELQLSAISEAMNQMIGSSCTSISSMVSKKIDITPPTADYVDFATEDKHTYSLSYQNTKIVKISFKMVVGTLIDSEIMQLIPISFAKDLVRSMLDVQNGQTAKKEEPLRTVQPQETVQPDIVPPPIIEQPVYQPQMEPQPQFAAPPQNYQYVQPQMNMQQDAVPKQSINVQPVQFQSVDDSHFMTYKENIGLIMDVPLQVTVELGRATRMIREILEFGPGSIVELDKLAGEPVDILVNGKIIAKGEVVVIDESFGVRITDIVHPSKRI